jgi:hypothetical protein
VATKACEERGGSLRRSAPVAQWTERRTSNPRVAGSNPARRTSLFMRKALDVGQFPARGHFFGRRP